MECYVIHLNVQEVNCARIVAHNTEHLYNRNNIVHFITLQNSFQVTG